jgi:SAM-dependent methyltransferase
VLVDEQIRSGFLVCPKTKEKLTATDDGQWLENASRTARYRLVNGKTPVLLADEQWAEEYSHGSEQMTREYSSSERQSLLLKLRHVLIRDFRTKASVEAFNSLFRGLPNDALCVSVGGGPIRENENLTNLNVGPFPNVDVVGDAHLLPYADRCVDVIFCEAVFEHLQFPTKAAQELFRVLKPGGKAFICTPFLQPYHGYPHHYQNYTLTGHQLLFESAGFKIIEAGACVGPVYATMQMGATFIRYYLPRPLNQIARFGWSCLGILVRPLDKIVGNNANAYIMASSTYAKLERP